MQNCDTIKKCIKIVIEQRITARCPSNHNGGNSYYNLISCLPSLLKNKNNFIKKY